VLTSRKARSYARRETRQKRGQGRVHGEADLADWDIAELVSQEPTPEFILQLAQACERLLGSLEDVRLHNIAVLRLEGYTVDEIASRVGCARRSVERRLHMIRKAWTTDSPGLETRA
jgi:DNA-directed RNA polymerase specialized sigma24 family protein